MGDDSRIKAFLEAESVYSFDGDIKRQPLTLQHHSYLLRQHFADARAAEALLLSADHWDPLTAAKTAIARGAYEEAKEHIRLLGATEGPYIQPEALLEMARIAFFESEWALGVACASQGLSRQPSLPTRMTLLQVRSSCYFELGAFEAALPDMNSIITIQRLFPNARVGFLSGLTRSKIEAKSVGIAEGRRLLKKSWDEFFATPAFLQRDSLVALARAEIFIARLEGQGSLPWAQLALALSIDSGDDLFTALATLDVLVESEQLRFQSDDQVHVPASLTASYNRFSRLRYLFEDISRQEPQSLSAQILRQHILSRRPSSGASQELPAAIQDSKIYVKSHSLLITRNPFKVEDLRGNDRINQVIQSLAKPISKPELFQKIYGRKFSASLHDSTLRTMLTRIRSTYGLRINSKDRQVGLEDLGIL